MNLFISISICACMGGAAWGRKGESEIRYDRVQLSCLSTSISPSLFVITLFIYFLFLFCRKAACVISQVRTVYIYDIYRIPDLGGGVYDNFIYRYGYGMISYPASPGPSVVVVVVNSGTNGKIP